MKLSDSISHAVVCDFDGTITQLDVGNELHRKIFPAEFLSLQSEYRAGRLNLRALQKKMWTNFPMSQAQFRAEARQFQQLRSGFVEFLRMCQKNRIGFYVVSCGIRDYIESVLQSVLAPSEREAIAHIYCNDAKFSDVALTELVTPEADHSELTLDKGRIADELRVQHPGVKILGIGNGTSDRSMHGHVDSLVATDGLARWAKSQKIEFIEFNDFSTLTMQKVFAE